MAKKTSLFALFITVNIMQN